MASVAVGERVGAVISFRNSGEGDYTTTVEYGVYDGEYPYPGSHLQNPRITLDNGDIVWGLMCWWGPEEEIRTFAQVHSIEEGLLPKEA